MLIVRPLLSLRLKHHKTQYPWKHKPYRPNREKSTTEISGTANKMYNFHHYPYEPKQTLTTTEIYQTEALRKHLWGPEQG